MNYLHFLLLQEPKVCKATAARKGAKNKRPSEEHYRKVACQLAEGDDGIDAELDWEEGQVRGRKKSGGFKEAANAKRSAKR